MIQYTSKIRLKASAVSDPSASLTVKFGNKRDDLRRGGAKEEAGAQDPC